MSTAAALKTSPVVNDAVRARVAPKRQEARPDAKFADIAANPFYSIMFSEATPEQKRSELAKALSFTGTKAEMKQRVAEFELFKEYLSAVRETMAVEIIKLTDTEAFSELQATYRDNNTDLIEFEEAMRPLQEIIDALHTLRTNGKTLDIFQEIRNDKEREKAIAKERAERASEVDIINANIRELQLKIEEAKRNRSWGGLGGVKPEAQRDIDEASIEIDNRLKRLDAIKADLANLDTATTANTEFAAEKAKLRQLLDLTSEEHKDRQKAVVDTALKFVQNSKARLGSVREHLAGMSSQINNLVDANGQMHMIYAVMNEGIGDAAKTNGKTRQEMLNPAADEDAMQKLMREQKLSDIESYISELDESRRTTQLTYADLSKDRVRIKDMKGANDGQISTARALQTQGIAGVASQLSTVLQAVSQAALNESVQLTRDTLGRMSDLGDDIAQKETIRVAMGVDEANADVMKAIEGVSQYTDTLRAATEIERAGWTQLNSNLERLTEISQEAGEALKESHGIRADSNAGAAPSAAGRKTSPSPFTFAS